MIICEWVTSPSEWNTSALRYILSDMFEEVMSSIFRKGDKVTFEAATNMSSTKRTVRRVQKGHSKLAVQQFTGSSYMRKLYPLPVTLRGNK